MTTRRALAKGFTLVEILIVVVILGILAAIVIPQFSSASDAAKSGNLETQLRQIRSQITLYSNEHNGDYPTLTGANWDDLIQFTDIDGGNSATQTATHVYGPYLLEEPINPFTNSSLVNTTVTGGAATDGWAYNVATGEVRAIFEGTAADAAALGLDVATADPNTGDVNIVAP
ncbi:MAG: prepilin-type N-terminal cleavage/methylation domain-containing protein [Planctomycetota bacterium]